MLRNYRKPLVIAAPKVGLKHPKANSNISEFAPGNVFQPTIVKDFGSGHAKKVILCSGKVAFDIEAKLEGGASNTRVVRVEEIAPFPTQRIRQHLEGAEQAIWMQEESMN